MIQFRFDVWKQVMRYRCTSDHSWFGRNGKWCTQQADLSSCGWYCPRAQADHELGIFANIFQLALLITIMIQAFRMAAEPFFNDKNENDSVSPARIISFVIACCFMFLFRPGLFLDIFRWIFTFANPRWAEGLEVVPLWPLVIFSPNIYYNHKVFGINWRIKIHMALS